MAKVQNTFLKSKMNKDLDARLLPEGEYRDARNVQVSKSEGSKVTSGARTKKLRSCSRISNMMRKRIANCFWLSRGMSQNIKIREERGRSK